MLANTNLANTAETLVYTCPVATRAVVTISMCVRDATSSLRLAVANNNTPHISNYIEYDASVPAGGVLERTGVVLSASERVYARTSVANVSINIYGITESA